MLERVNPQRTYMLAMTSQYTSFHSTHTSKWRYLRFDFMMIVITFSDSNT
jgi:hypothetical protein